MSPGETRCFPAMCRKNRKDGRETVTRQKTHTPAIDAGRPQAGAVSPTRMPNTDTDELMGEGEIEYRE